MTGRGDRELVVKAAQAGVNNYLVKPFTQVTLREKIEQVIEFAGLKPIPQILTLDLANLRFQDGFSWNRD